MGADTSRLTSTQMRRPILLGVLVIILFGILAPPAASADALFSPWVALIGGNEVADGRRAVGWTAGGMRGGLIGGEIDFGFAPNFLDQPVDNSALTVMGNVIVGVPVGGSTGGGLRPYVTGGVGLMRTQIDTLSGRDDARNDPGLNLGAGLIGFLGDHFGLRADLRHFRTLRKETGPTDAGPVGLDLGSAAFWRTSVGIVIR